MNMMFHKSGKVGWEWDKEANKDSDLKYRKSFRDWAILCSTNLNGKS